MRRMILTVILLFAVQALLAQPFMMYKGVLRNTAGEAIATQHFGLKVKLYEDSPTGLLAWEEMHDPTTAANGRFEILIGQGIPGTVFYSSFNQIPWAQHAYFMTVEIDYNLTGTYVIYATSRLLSVPYAMHSLTADVPYSLHRLNDVDITLPLVAGQVLKWNGLYWINAADNDSDTAAYVPITLSAQQADTAQWVWYFPIDTVAYTQHTNLSINVAATPVVSHTNHTPTADTAQYALLVPTTTWLLSGNSPGSLSSPVLGSTDSADVGLSTNHLLRLRFSKSGDVSNSGVFYNGFYLQHNGLFLHTLTGPGIMQMSGGGTRWMFVSHNGAFRAGTVTGTLWDSVSVKPYSFAFGENCNSGSYSFAAGKNNIASGDNAMVFGRANIASAMGAGGNGTSFCVGDSSLATGIRTVVLGRQCQAGNSTAIAIGYKTRAMANVSTVIGNNSTTTTGLYSMVLGSYANGSNRQGCFLYGDRSTTTFMIPTANHQFRIRAAGGIYFYSDPLLASGVALLPGAGSWSTLSDARCKENLEEVNHETILKGIAELKIRSWSYRAQENSIRHIGPTAQQFKKIFGYGESKKMIAVVDADGVIMAGILGIDQRHQRFLQQYHNTGTRLSELQESYTTIEQRLQIIESIIQKK